MAVFGPCLTWRALYDKFAVKCKRRSSAAPSVVKTATNSMAGATYFEMGPEQLLGVHGLASSVGAPSHGFIPTPQHTGHPHPVLVLINLGLTPLITSRARLKELGARLLPALSSIFGWFPAKCMEAP
jgi:hypothetical protein